MRKNLSTSLTDPKIELQQPILFFGVGIPSPSTFPRHLIQKAFYHDPQVAAPSAPQSHTHAVLIQDPPPQTEQNLFTLMKSPTVNFSAHLLSTSLICEAFLLSIPLVIQDLDLAKKSELSSCQIPNLESLSVYSLDHISF